MSAGTKIRCSKCGASFACDPAGDCWCKAPPYLPLPAANETCLCPDCLASARAAGAGSQKSDAPRS